jgi:hypothetical protein
MRYKITVLLLVLLTTQAPADLHFTGPEADAGTVRTGTALTHTFTFTNTGPDPVTITDLRASCGCLTPHLEKRTYQPDEQGAIQLEVNTLTQPAGLQSWRLTVSYRDGATAREQSLRLNAQMVREISVQPAALVLIATGALQHTITITDARPHPLTVTAARSTAPALRLAIRTPVSVGHTTVDVLLGADYPEGRHDETISIYTDDPSYRELRIPVTVDRRSRQRIIARPHEVQLEKVQGQPVLTRIVLLQDRNNQPITVDSIKADDLAVSARWAAGPGNMATVRVIIDQKQLHGATLNTTLHIHLTQPTSAEVLLPVSCQ